MRDSYVADVGDFGKYALLNALAGNDLRLGVLWCCNSEPDATRDGRFTSRKSRRFHFAVTGVSKFTAEIADRSWDIMQLGSITTARHAEWQPSSPRPHSLCHIATVLRAVKAGPVQTSECDFSIRFRVVGAGGRE